MSTPVSTPAHRTPMELYRSGIAALQQQLGPVDAIRFLHLLDHGSGDYTAERQSQDDDATMADLCAEIRSTIPAQAS